MHISGTIASGLVVLFLAGAAAADSQQRVLSGQGALGDWTTDAPGVRRRITLADLPKPFATGSATNDARMVKRPEGAWPRVPDGFQVEEFASGLDNPRLVRVAPNGDLFLAESYPGRIRVLRARDGAGKVEVNEVFASGLERPFGIAFYPPGPDPRWVYVGETGAVVRFPYQKGDLKARGKKQVIVGDIPSGGRLQGGVLDRVQAPGEVKRVARRCVGHDDNE